MPFGYKYKIISADQAENGQFRFRFVMEGNMKWKDNDETNAENEESYDEINYGDEYSPLGSGKRNGFIFRLFNRAEFPIVVLGIGLLALIIIFFVYMPRFQKSTATIDLTEIKNSIKLLEDRLANLEMSNAKNKKPDQQVARYNKLDSKIKKMSKSMDSRIDKMNSKLEELRNKMPAVKPLQVAREAITKESGKKVKIRTHLVRAGETLYSISQQYGVSVDSLRGLNKLDAKTDIYPGQKLKINTE